MTVLHRLMADPVLFYGSAVIVSLVVLSQVGRIERFRREKVVPWLDKHGILLDKR